MDEMNNMEYEQDVMEETTEAGGLGGKLKTAIIGGLGVAFGIGAPKVVKKIKERRADKLRQKTDNGIPVVNFNREDYVPTNQGSSDNDEK